MIRNGVISPEAGWPSHGAYRLSLPPPWYRRPVAPLPTGGKEWCGGFKHGIEIVAATLDLISMADVNSE